jgi:feruloyl esterase
MLSALEAWVDRGTAPEAIVASKVEIGRVTRARPLCAWPRRAVYSGAGNPDQASNYRCRAGAA